MEAKKRLQVSEYVAPRVDFEELLPEQGFTNSTFGVETEEIEDLEELC